MKTATIVLALIILMAPQILAACSGSNEDIHKLCEEKGSPGILALECDETCKSFVVCYISANKLLGIIKYCPTGKYFDNSKTYCHSQKPDYCT